MTDEEPRVPASAKRHALPADLERLLRPSLGRRYGDPDGWSMRLVSEQGRPGRERRLIHAHRPATGQELAIKANARPADNKRQYRALRNLRRRTEACVAPLYMAKGAWFFVMEWVNAPLLMDRLDRPDRPADLARVGDWLARLHAATFTHPFLTPKPHVVSTPKGGGGLLEEVSAQLGARMRSLPLRTGPTAMLHGDFHPGNLFVTDGRLLAFDRKLDRYGPMFFDLATFLVDLAHLRNLAVEAGRPWAEDPEADRQCFFEGYGALQEQDLALYDLVEDPSSSGGGTAGVSSRRTICGSRTRCRRGACRTDPPAWPAGGRHSRHQLDAGTLFDPAPQTCGACCPSSMLSCARRVGATALAPRRRGWAA